MSFGIPKNFFPFISDVKVNCDFLEKQRKPTLFDKNLPLGIKKGDMLLKKKKNLIILFRLFDLRHKKENYGQIDRYRQPLLDK